MTSEQARKLSSIFRQFCDAAKNSIDSFAQLADDALKVLSEPDTKQVSVATFDGRAAQLKNGLVNRKEIAELLGVCVRTVGNLIKDGLPTVPVRGRLQFDCEEVLTWAKDRRIRERGKTKLRVVS